MKSDKQKTNRISTTNTLEMFPDISRDVLYFIEKKKLIVPEKENKPGGKRSRRFYSEGDIRKLFVASQAYRAGLRPDRVLSAIGKPSLIKNEKELAMGRLLAGVLRELFWGDRGRVWDVLLRGACQQLECEACLLYHRSSANDAMVPTAGKSKRGIEFDLERIPVRTPPAEWEDWVNAKGTPVNLSGKLLTHDRFVKQGAPEYLVAGKHFSLLAVPIRYRKDANLLRGWLVAENRIDSHRPTGEGCYFDPAVQAAAEVIGDLASLIFDALPYLQAPRQLMSAIRKQQGLDGFLHDLLDATVRITGADRGDVSWVDRNSDGAMVIAQIGDSGVPPGVFMAKRSVSRRVLETGQLRLIPDVSKDPDYFECDPRTRSEICVPVIPPRAQNPVSVINLESEKLNGFDKFDCRILEELAEYAAVYGHILETTETISGLTSSSHSQAAGAQAAAARTGSGLLQILKEVAEDHGLDKGIVYMADYRKGELRCAAVNGFDDQAKAYDKSVHAFTTPSLATKVFHQGKPHFVRNAKDDLSLSKQDVDLFDMSGPLFGIPLLFGSTVIGVMVVWSSKEDLVTLDKEAALTGYGTLAITTRARAQAEATRSQELRQHSTVLSAIREVLTQMATQSTGEALHSILKALIKADFRRARVFEYDKQEGLFRCLDSMSRDPHEPSYKGVEVKIAASLYAQKTVCTRPGEAAAIRDPRVALQDDPYAQELGKSPFLPWAVATLFVGGVLYGYLACDNSPGGEPISKANLESLNAFGALAAHAVASHQSQTRAE